MRSMLPSEGINVNSAHVSQLVKKSPSQTFWKQSANGQMYRTLQHLLQAGLTIISVGLILKRSRVASTMESHVSKIEIRHGISLYMACRRVKSSSRILSVG